MILLIDYNNLMIRMLSVYSSLEYNGIYTGAVFGVLNQLTKLVVDYHPEELIAVTDAYPLKRKAIFPEYKSHRKKTINEKLMRDSRSTCNTLMDYMGIPILRQVGYESDDIIGHLILTNPHRSFLIVSTDSDLERFLSGNVEIFKSGKIFTTQDFKAKYQNAIKPCDLETIECFIGNHNGVPPLVKGLGLKRYLKLTAAEKLDLINANRSLFERNERLVKIPFDDQIKVDFTAVPTFKRRKLENWLMRDLGIRLTKQMELAFDILA